MKDLKAGTLCVLLCLCYSFSSAQKKIPLNEPDMNRPRLFNNLPSRTSFKPSTLDFVFEKKAGTFVSIIFSDKLRIDGTVTSTSGDADTLVRSAVILLSTGTGSVFSVSRVRQADGTVSYRGRLINRSSGDALEMMEENGEYVLLKKSFYDVMSE